MATRPNIVVAGQSRIASETQPGQILQPSNPLRRSDVLVGHLDLDLMALFAVSPEHTERARNTLTANVSPIANSQCTICVAGLTSGAVGAEATKDARLFGSDRRVPLDTLDEFRVLGAGSPGNLLPADIMSMSVSVSWVSSAALSPEYHSTGQPLEGRVEVLPTNGLGGELLSSLLCDIHERLRQAVQRLGRIRTYSANFRRSAQISPREMVSASG